jgi:hypothetical protein
MELHNMDPAVLDELYKIASINLSPNTPGQVHKGLIMCVYIYICIYVSITYTCLCIYMNICMC